LQNREPARLRIARRTRYAQSLVLHVSLHQGQGELAVSARCGILRRSACETAQFALRRPGIFSPGVPGTVAEAKSQSWSTGDHPQFSDTPAGTVDSLKAVSYRCLSSPASTFRLNS